MATLNDVERFVSDHPDRCELGEPASEELIQRAEEFLGLHFPPDYRKFLSRFGTLAYGPLEFYGITRDNNFVSSSVPNAIWYTGVLRQRDLPPALVILYDNNGDEYYCLDTASPRGRVIVWDAIDRSVIGVKAESASDFILQEVADLDLDT